MRICFVVLMLVTLIVVLATEVTIKSDAGAVLGSEGSLQNAMAIEPSQELIIGVDAATPDIRVAVAKTITVALAADPLIQDVSFGPTQPSQGFLDWVWDKRFQLAPPSPEDFSSTRMAENLNAARNLFSSMEGAVLSDQLLLDPTGSYMRVVDRLEDIAAQPDQFDGVWQSIDGKTSLLFATFRDRPFDATEVYTLIENVRSIAADQEASVYFLGARTIAAETTFHTATASAFASTLAGGLLLAWLIFSLRSFVAAFYIFLPLALGVASAILFIQLLFGYVHVISLGFGGALVGLALDYPIHLLGYSEANRRRAFRLILLGAMTTSLAFLAMLGSEIPALIQTGIFVASGLTVSALASVFLPSPKVQIHAGISLKKFVWKLPYKPVIESCLAVSGLLFVLSFQREAPLTLFGPPPEVAAEIKLMGTKLKLPSARYAISVGGRDFDELLANEKGLSQTLEAAVADGVIESYSMVSNFIPPSKPFLPPVKDYRDMAKQALQLAGMSPTFVDRQVEAYALARSSSRISFEELNRFPEMRVAVGRLEKVQSGFHEYVQLFLPEKAGPPNMDIQSPKATMVDFLVPVRQAIAKIQNQVVLWLGVGVIVAVPLLGMGLRSWKSAGRIFLTSAAAVGITASIMVVFFGTLSIFQILALALVVGIGVDYSLFIKELKGTLEKNTASLSVSLCASSTLIAFLVLSLSSVQILHQVGLTVVVGLLVMLLFTLAETKRDS